MAPQQTVQQISSSERADESCDWLAEPAESGESETDFMDEGAGVPTGTPLSDPALIEMISEDPVLRGTHLIAEAWDAAGLYQVTPGQELLNLGTLH